MNLVMHIPICTYVCAVLFELKFFPGLSRAYALLYDDHEYNMGHTEDHIYQHISSYIIIII